MFRVLVTKELAELLGVLSHPHRLRIVEELGMSELDVAALAEALSVRSSAMSQQLSLLRAHGVVTERREGRHVYYRLKRPEIAAWLLDGLKFIEPQGDEDELQRAVSRARETWGHEEVEATTAARRVAKRKK